MVKSLEKQTIIDLYGLGCSYHCLHLKKLFKTLPGQRREPRDLLVLSTLPLS
jgi:hypothetical protein